MHLTCIGCLPPSQLFLPVSPIPPPTPAPKFTVCPDLGSLAYWCISRLLLLSRFSCV